MTRPDTLDAQRDHWERTLAERSDRFGADASRPAIAAANVFRKATAVSLLELGAGQGRDTLFFAESGFQVAALDYGASAVAELERKALQRHLQDRVRPLRHDVRQPLPFADESFDGCYSHMLYCMALTGQELGRLSSEIRRVLRPGGLSIYTARTVRDPDYGKGTHHGGGLYELGGFIVHFFDRAMIERLADGFEILHVSEFDEGALPRHLFLVTLRRPAG